jgi:tetratricopeptide (TPR) repeat protein
MFRRSFPGSKNGDIRPYSNRASRDSLGRLALFALVLAVFIGGGCSRQARFERRLAQANKDFEAEAYVKAEVEYTGARQLVPLNPVAIRQLGIIYLDDGRPNQAYSYLKKAVELDPKDVAAQVKLAEAYFTMRGIKEARDAAKIVLDRDPSNEEALLLLSNTTRTSAEQTETTEIVEKLRSSNKDCAGYHLVLGRMLLMKHDLTGAEKEARAAITLDPKSRTAYGDLGEILLLQHDTKQAGEAFRNAAQLAPLRSAVRLRDIDFRLRSGDAAQAKKDLAELSEKAPDYIPARVYTMKLAYGERRYDDCAAEIQTILARDSTNYDAVTERGILKMARNDPTGAVADLKKAEDLYPRVPQVKFELAAAYVRSGDMTRAADKLNEAIKLAPDYNEAILLLAELNIRKGDAAAAVVLLNPILERSPQVREAYLGLAQAYLTEKNQALALRVYQRMAAAFPKDPEPRYRAGIVLGQAGRKPEEREAFEDAVKIAPSYFPALEMLVKLDLDEKHESAAANRVQDLMTKYPKSGAPWYLKGEIDLAAKRVDQAESDLRKAVDLEPDAQQSYLALTRLYLATHKTKEALDELAVLVDKTKSVTAQLQIGAIHTALGQFQEAAADYRKVLASNPKSGPALNNLAYIDAEDLGKLDEAYEIAKRAREAAPEDGNVADTLGWVLFKKGDYHGALDLFQESAGQQPENATVAYHQGLAHYMLGEEQSARVAFEHSATTSADATLTEKVKNRLAVLAIDPATVGPEARDELEKWAKADPNDPVVAVRLAALQSRGGSATEAAAAFESALKSAPQNLQAMLGLARLYAGPLHNPAKARELAKSAHELAPNDPNISAMLGKLVYQTGDYQWSLDLLEEGARGLPHDSELMYNLALADYSVGRITDAEQALSAARGGTGTFTSRGEADRFAAMLEASGNPASAESAAGEAAKILATDPGYMPALMVSGLAKEQEGDASGASKLYEQVLGQDPLFSPATRQLARIYVQRTGEDEKAYNMASKAREAFPTDPEVAKTLGIVDYRRADYSKAASLFEESLRGQPGDAESVYYLGMSHYNLKETDASKSELERALGLKLSDQESDEAKRVLDELKGNAQGPSLSSQPIN